MSSRRVLKVAEAIREVVSMAILTELRDPRISDVTVTYVEVSADLRHAKVHVSVMGGEAKQKLSLRGLQNAAGFLQQKVARRIETRYTPRLTFLLDQGVKHSIEVSRLLSELLPAEDKPGDGTGDEDPDERRLDAQEPLDDEELARRRRAIGRRTGPRADLTRTSQLPDRRARRIARAKVPMSNPNRSALINTTYKVLQEHYQPCQPPADRTLFEHLLYACCLENARPEAADEAYAKLQQTFFDWNEVRVTTVNELAETMSSLPDGTAAAKRLKQRCSTSSRPITRSTSSS